MKNMKTIFLVSFFWLAAAAIQTQAQTIFRIVGEGGKVTFSDKAPPETSPVVVSSNAGSVAGSANAAGLPFELRQAVSKYPVTLYSGTDCAPCTAGRALLVSRGIPFSERTVSTQEDVASLQKLTGESTLPFLTVGGQRIKGFADLEWTQYLDAAGYPRVSVLPASFKNPAPSPLVSLQQPVAPVKPKAEEKPESEAKEVSRPVIPAVTPANPAGIQF
jgi:glutaredoxin